MIDDDARAALTAAVDEVAQRLARTVDDGEYWAATAENAADAVIAKLSRDFGGEVTIRAVADVCAVNSVDLLGAPAYVAPLIVAGARARLRGLRG